MDICLQTYALLFSLSSLYNNSLCICIYFFHLYLLSFAQKTATFSEKEVGHTCRIVVSDCVNSLCVCVK